MEEKKVSKLTTIEKIELVLHELNMRLHDIHNSACCILSIGQNSGDEHEKEVHKMFFDNDMEMLGESFVALRDTLSEVIDFMDANSMVSEETNELSEANLKYIYNDGEELKAEK